MPPVRTPKKHSHKDNAKVTATATVIASGTTALVTSPAHYTTSKPYISPYLASASASARLSIAWHARIRDMATRLQSATLRFHPIFSPLQHIRHGIPSFLLSSASPQCLQALQDTMAMQQGRRTVYALEPAGAPNHVQISLEAQSESQSLAVSLPSPVARRSVRQTLSVVRKTLSSAEKATKIAKISSFLGSLEWHRLQIAKKKKIAFKLAALAQIQMTTVAPPPTARTQTVLTSACFTNTATTTATTATPAPTAAVLTTLAPVVVPTAPVKERMAESMTVANRTTTDTTADEMTTLKTNAITDTATVLEIMNRHPLPASPTQVVSPTASFTTATLNAASLQTTALMVAPPTTLLSKPALIPSTKVKKTKTKAMARRHIAKTTVADVEMMLKPPPPASEGRLYRIPKTGTYYRYHAAFEKKLERLYKIEYGGPVGARLSVGNWDRTFYYHATGDCACLMNWNETGYAGEEKLAREGSHLWCDVQGCPIQGILNHGFLMNFNVTNRGHYFSRDVNVARQYGMRKCEARTMLAIFICKARHWEDYNKAHKIKVVRADQDLHAIYLAIVHV